MMQMLLQLADVVASYRGLVAVNGISLDIGSAGAAGVVGPNGAGKSTLANCVVGLKSVERGTIAYDGRRANRRAWRRVRAGIGYVPEGRRVFTDMTVRENLLVATRLRRGTAESRTDELLGLFPVLAERRSQQAGTLSGGEQQMLAIARALMGQPKLLVLDEPTMGLAPAVVERVRGHLHSIRHDLGVGLLICEQSLARVGSVVDTVHVLQRGEIIASGVPDDPALETAFNAAVAGEVAPTPT
jgi:branched-chain amino acid transport system ATP-binding protein